MRVRSDGLWLQDGKFLLIRRVYSVVQISITIFGFIEAIDLNSETGLRDRNIIETLCQHRH